ncbi:hypothetical protein D3C73_1174090 [compost metagenome]
MTIPMVIRSSVLNPCHAEIWTCHSSPFAKACGKIAFTVGSSNEEAIIFGKKNKITTRAANIIGEMSIPNGASCGLRSSGLGW